MTESNDDSQEMMITKLKIPVKMNIAQIQINWTERGTNFSLGYENHSAVYIL